MDVCNDSWLIHEAISFDIKIPMATVLLVFWYLGKEFTKGNVQNHDISKHKLIYVLFALSEGFPPRDRCMLYSLIPMQDQSIS